MEKNTLVPTIAHLEDGFRGTLEHGIAEDLKSKKVNNLFFTGQLTVPGPGVPPALISGKLVAELIVK